MYFTAQSLLGTHIAHSLYICSVPSIERTNVQLRFLPFLLVKITMEFLQCEQCRIAAGASYSWVHALKRGM